MNLQEQIEDLIYRSFRHDVDVGFKSKQLTIMIMSLIATWYRDEIEK